MGFDVRFPDYSNIPDAEERALAHASQLKADTIAALALAAEARKARGEDTTEIREALDFEDMTRSGYQRALDKRRRELAAGATKGGR